MYYHFSPLETFLISLSSLLPPSLPAEGEKMTSGELEEFVHQVVSSGTLLEFGSSQQQQPRELLRSTMTSNSTALDQFLTALGEGQCDTTAPKSKVSGQCLTFIA